MIPPTRDRLIDRIRASLFPRVDPELRISRTRLARTIMLAQLGLLAGWAAVLFLASGLQPGMRIGTDLLGIVALALISGLGLWLLRRGSVNTVGYLISLGLYVFVALGAALVPDYLILVSVAFMLPILTSGAIVGGSAPYLFAAAAIITNSVIMLTTDRSAVVSQDIWLAIYLSTHAVVATVAALISSSLSRQVQRTLGSLHTQADQMAKLAHTDPLTGLANRRHLFEQLESEFARAQRYRRPFSLLYIDLDGFKEINDQFGHLFGDEILRGSARSMQAVLRATDLLARIGGDEFAVLLPETNLTGAKSVSVKLRKALAAYGGQLSPSMPELTLSVGVGQINEDDDAIEDILARADKAQYLAKSAGKALTRTQDDLEAAEPA
jgi:diguanylate cyclase (GGDEF)-like protein